MSEKIIETRPLYYTTFVHEAKEVIEDLGHGEGFYVGNVIKYLFRMGKKEGSSKLEDAYKARQYLNFLIELLESEEEP